MTNSPRRTTRDLIAELGTAAEGVDLAALVVGFAERTEFVWSHDAGPHATLKEKMALGGEPIALIVHDGRKLKAWAIQEHRDDGWVEGYVQGIAAGLLKNIREPGRTANFVNLNFLRPGSGGGIPVA